MRYLQYKGLLERENKKSLKKIMYEICVVEGLNATRGAKKLGIAKEIFMYWRQYYRFEKRQLLFDQTIEEISELKYTYADEVENYDFKKPLEYENEESVQGLDEVIKRSIEYYKFLHYKSEGLAIETAKLPLYEFSHHVVEGYRNKTLKEEIAGRNEG
ncbi:hypothetical protein [Planococcus sp. YIM B11945]|uniref:hypothetical protein n=1 Tax=Planococcus sp. YIM B11945 TaxID=3435410 RepID=UPI003D7D04DD